ncbi:MAG: MFS transporter [Microbacterium sp.]|uniref:MFS transporter n=1 Tax=Microbacterium sp. TaxID=51671 RepID=UPI0039E3D8CC
MSATDTGNAPAEISPSLARRAVPILLAVFVFSLVIDNAFKYVTGAIATSLDLSLNAAGLQATIPGILIGIGAVVYAALADAVSIRRLTVLAIILICIGSIVGFAFQGSWGLVLTGRIVQTAGLAAAETLYVIWVTKHFAGAQQKAYLGFSTAAFQLSLLLGVVGGGFIATYVSWPVLFLAALLPLLALPVVLKTVPPEQTRSSSLDVFGLFLVAVVAGGIIMFLQAFQWLYLVAVVIALGLFVWHVARNPKALISPAFFANKQYTLVLLVVFVMYSVQLGYVVTFPVLMEATHGMSGAESSLLLIPGYICAVLVGVFTGAIARFLDSHRAIVLALVLITVALLVPAFFVDAPVAVYILSMALFPSGFALMYAPLLSTAVKSIAPEKTGVAIGFYNLTINMAIPIGIAYTLNLIGQNLGFMSGLASPAGAPFAAVMLILGLIGVLAIVMYLSFARVLHRDNAPVEQPVA